MKRLLFFAVLVVFAASFSGCVTFDSVNGLGNPILTSLTTEGYTFTSQHFHAVGQPGICSFGGCVDDGTVYIQEEAGGLGQPITMTAADSSRFTLIAFSGAQPFLNDEAAGLGGFPNAAFVDVVGTVFGGGTVNTSCPLNGIGFTFCTLPPTFTNLVSVTFSGSAANEGAGGIALDNIIVLPTFGPPPSASHVTSFKVAPSTDSLGDPSMMHR